MYLPLLFKEGLQCLIIGGGEVAARKLDSLLEVPCTVTVIAPHISERMAAAVRKGSIRWMKKEYSRGDCQGYQLIVAATPLREINRRIFEEAGEFGIPINVVDDPELSTVIFPAVWRDRSLLVAVSTEGDAPFMSSEIRTKLARFSQGMGRWVELGGRFRKIVRREIGDKAEKMKLYRRFLDAGQPEDFDAPPDSDRLDDWLEWLDRVRGRRY
jgi:siroheme synthase-like protein